MELFKFRRRNTAATALGYPDIVRVIVRKALAPSANVDTYDLLTRWKKLQDVNKTFQQVASGELTELRAKLPPLPPLTVVPTVEYSRKTAGQVALRMTAGESQAFSAGRKQLLRVARRYYGPLEVFDQRSGKSAEDLYAAEGYNLRAISPDAQYVVGTARYGQGLFLWHLRGDWGRSWMGSLGDPEKSFEIEEPAFSADGTHLAATYGDDAHIWNLSRDPIQHTVLHQEHRISSVTLSRTGAFAALFTHGKAFLYDLRAPCPSPFRLKDGRDPSLKMGPPSRFAFSPNSLWMASTSMKYAGGSVLDLWKIHPQPSRARQLAETQPHTYITLLGFSPYGRYLAYGYEEKYNAALKLIDLRHPSRAPSTITGSSLPGLIDAVAFSPDNSRLAIATDEGFVSLWKIGERKHSCVFVAPEAAAVRNRSRNYGEHHQLLSFSPDGQWLASSKSMFKFPTTQCEESEQ